MNWGMQQGTANMAKLWHHLPSHLGSKHGEHGVSIRLLRWPRARPGSGLLNVFIKDLDDGIEKALIKFADDMKLGGTTSILEDRIRIQNDLDKLEKWTGKNRMKFNRDKCKAVR